jgi:glyoxylase I family protein
MIIGIHHANCTVSNMDRSILFYRDMLGLRLLYTFEHGDKKPVHRSAKSGTGVEGAHLRVAVFQAGPKSDDRFELIEYVTPKGKRYDRQRQDVGMHICFLVDDIYKTYDELVRKGVKFATTPNEIGEGPMKGFIWCYFTDPDGLNLEIAQIVSGEP